MLVCGGAADIYVDCKKQYNSSAMSCDRNIECVTTAGNAKWCTGPKMKDCYIYDPYFTQDFQIVTKVNFFNKLRQLNEQNSLIDFLYQRKNPFTKAFDIVAKGNIDIRGV